MLFAGLFVSVWASSLTSGVHGRLVVVFFDGRGLEQFFENVYLRQIAWFGCDCVVEIDQLLPALGLCGLDYHFFQVVVVSRSISFALRGRTYHESVAGVL
ncbi:MAG: hypothetical protein ACLRS8_14585 [Parabacteroides merdae]